MNHVASKADVVESLYAKFSDFTTHVKLKGKVDMSELFVQDLHVGLNHRYTVDGRPSAVGEIRVGTKSLAIISRLLFGSPITA